MVAGEAPMNREQELEAALRRIISTADYTWLRWTADAFEDARPQWSSRADWLRKLDATIVAAETLVPDARETE